MKAFFPFMTVFFVVGSICGHYFGSIAAACSLIAYGVAYALVAFLGGRYGPTVANTYSIYALPFILGTLIFSGTFGRFFVWLRHIIY